MTARSLSPLPFAGSWSDRLPESELESESHRHLFVTDDRCAADPGAPRIQGSRLEGRAERDRPWGSAGSHLSPKSGGCRSVGGVGGVDGLSCPLGCGILGVFVARRGKRQRPYLGCRVCGFAEWRGGWPATDESCADSFTDEQLDRRPKPPRRVLVARACRTLDAGTAHVGIKAGRGLRRVRTHSEMRAAQVVPRATSQETNPRPLQAGGSLDPAVSRPA
jgi:hypothetical protein